MAMSFLEYCLYDNDWRQRHDIDMAIETETTDVSMLNTQLAGMRAQIRELSITVGVLVRMLAEHVPVEADTLKYRVEAAVDAMSSEATGRITCVRCGALRVPSSTLMTASGPICDPGCPVPSP